MKTQYSTAWEFHNPTRILYGFGKLPCLLKSTNFKRIILVTTKGFTNRGVTQMVRDNLGARLIDVIGDVQPNPDVSNIDAQVKRIRNINADAIFALGGGSSIDTGKALAKLMREPAGTSVAHHFRSDRTWATTETLPVIAIPTTAGTGSEVTPFATVWDYKTHKKHSISGPYTFPKFALIDPELTLNLPFETTLSSGLDSISHALESIWNKNSNPITMMIAIRSLQLSISSLPKVIRYPKDNIARSNMMQASLLSGMAISHTRTALAHSISYPLTSNLHIPHGIACSFTLPALMKFNLSSDDGRFLELARNLGLNDKYDLPKYLSQFLNDIGLYSQLKSYINNNKQIFDLANGMFSPERANNNLRAASCDDIKSILDKSLTQSSI